MLLRVTRKLYVAWAMNDELLLLFHENCLNLEAPIDVVKIFTSVMNTSTNLGGSFREITDQGAS